MLSATEMSLVLKEASDMARASQPELREQLIEVREAALLLREENLQLRVRCAELRRRLHACEALQALRLERSQLQPVPPQQDAPAPSLRPPLSSANPAAGENEQAAVCPGRPPLRRRPLGL